MVGTGKSTIAQTVAQSGAARSKLLLHERRWQARQPLTAFHHHRPMPLRSTSFDQSGSRCCGRRQRVAWRGKESRLAARGDCGAALLYHQTKEISQPSLCRASALGHPCAHNYPLMRTVTYRVLACCTRQMLRCELNVANRPFLLVSNLSHHTLSVDKSSACSDYYRARSRPCNPYCGAVETPKSTPNKIPPRSWSNATQSPVVYRSTVTYPFSHALRELRSKGKEHKAGH